MPADRRGVLPPAVALSISLLAWQTLLYPLTLAALARLRRRPAAAPSPDFAPSLTVLVRSYNEAGVIGRRIGNLLECDYPAQRLEILVVDSGSSDGTADLAEAFAGNERGVPVRVIREPSRRGTASALNLALPQAGGELVLLTDAPTLFEPDGLRRITARFADPSVGAATGFFRVPEVPGVAGEQEAAFWAVRNRLRQMEAEVDSTPFLSGEMCCFRRPLFVPMPLDTMADDMHIALSIRAAGYRTVVEPLAVYSEPRSADLRELEAAKARRAMGGLQQLVRFRRLMFRPRYGFFGLLILPSDLLYYLPIRALAGLAVLRWLLVGPVRRSPVPVVAAAVGAGVTALRRPSLLRFGFMAVFSEWLMLRSFLMWATGRYSVRWAREASTRAPDARMDAGDAAR